MFELVATIKTKNIALDSFPRLHEATKQSDQTLTPNDYRHQLGFNTMCGVFFFFAF